ncbi:MAG: CPBP family intramembrane glutamic endopeptidase [Acidiferrobacterales bacterium]
MNERHGSITIYFVLVFALTIPFLVAGALVPSELLPGVPLSAIAVIVPTLAACFFIYRGRRWPGVVELLRRSYDYRHIKNWRWFLVIFLVNPAIAVLAFWVMRASGTSIPLPGAIGWSVLPLAIVLLVGALVEEIGWTGYATEPLLRRHGVVVTGIVIGCVWAVWHVVLLLQVQRSFDWILWWSLGTVSLRIIMVWLYTHAGKSVFGATVFHAMINLSWQLFPVHGSYYDPRVFGLIALGSAIAMLSLGRKAETL